jgi:hypothetical protein
MTNNPADIPFRRRAVEPMKCLREGFNLVKDRYWFFVGMCFVAILVGSAVPFGVLMGPMMCGLYMTFFLKRRGQPIEFSTLFKGFDHFGQSVIATLIHVVPIVIIVVPAYLFFYIGFVLTIAASGNQREPDPAALFGFLGFMVLFWMAIVVIVVVVSIAFTFSYPLIVDRRLQGVDAVKLSARAAFANFWSLLGLSLISGLLGFVGVLLCYVGVFFVFPISYSALAIAYEQVFGISNTPAQPNLPPPPPVFS